MHKYVVCLLGHAKQSLILQSVCVLLHNTIITLMHFKDDE